MLNEDACVASHETGTVAQARLRHRGESQRTEALAGRHSILGQTSCLKFAASSDPVRLRDGPRLDEVVTYLDRSLVLLLLNVDAGDPHVSYVVDGSNRVTLPCMITSAGDILIDRFINTSS